MANQKKKHSPQFIIILMGPPGSGKGTQASRLSKELDFPHISTGDLFRENIRKGTELGLIAKEYIDKGLLGPDELVLDMLFDRLSNSDCKSGCILDGFPRTISQAEVLDQKFPDSHLIVVNLDVSDDEILKRIAGRLTCKQCGTVYHKETSPPKKSGICDKCGGELYQRVDDSENAVRRRLQEYNSKTAPVLNHYAYRGLKNIEGTRPPDIVFRDLITLVLNLMEEVGK